MIWVDQVDAAYTDARLEMVNPKLLSDVSYIAHRPPSRPAASTPIGQCGLGLPRTTPKAVLPYCESVQASGSTLTWRLDTMGG
jgi:hypothetical protein